MALKIEEGPPYHRKSWPRLNEVIAMSDTVGIIGSGMIGGQIARLAVAAGLKVVICNSRGPETLADLIAELGPSARAATVAEVAASSDLIVLAVPFATYASMPADTLAGKIIIDTLNYYPQRDGVMPEVKTDTIATTELVQRHLARSRVVRAINNVDFVRLLSGARPVAADRSALPVAGDDVIAKTAVITFLDRIGYDAVDMGPLSESWRSEPTTPVYVGPYMNPDASYVTKTIDVNTFMTAPGRTVSAIEVRELVNKAVRHGKMFGLLPVFSKVQN
jgi:predicted dinucleotide-binding enzyme